MNSFGKLFKVTIYGESHGPSVGVIISGIKPGIKVDYQLIESNLERRKPSYYGSTPRKEKDTYTIESGINQGYTTGTPILIRVLNEDLKKQDYNQFKEHYRPSHVDFVSNLKYQGYNNLSGSGHFSGRLTVGLVIAGAFAKMITNYHIISKFVQVGKLTDLANLESYIKEVADQKDSVGAVVKITVKGVEPGLGEPFFESVESKLSSILYSVPGIKGVSFGTGFAGVSLLGSEFNDPLITESGKTLTNHSGGINGGITNGNDLIVNVFVRPASSIGKPQETFNFKTKKIETLTITGRHDSFIAQRAVVVLESVIQIALCDLLLQKKSRQ
ncbi:MAG: chorismate synthase [Acholeplasmataceae bacterium]|jgi:chorismate synthase|nr:chorismate synthase [Acholeplasmataceae bacterium]